MKREKVLIVLGVLVLLSPWSGLPLTWLTWILLIIGAAVSAIGYSLWRKNRTERITSEPPRPLSPSQPEPRSSHIAFS